LRSVKLNGEICEVIPYGDHWCRIILPKDSLLQFNVLGRAIHTAKIEGLKNLIATGSEISIQADDLNPILEKIELIDFDRIINSSKIFRFPVYFSDHPDWNFVSEHTGLNKTQYVKNLLDRSYHIDMLGFLVGFFYCKQLDKKLKVPRKNIPSTQVESGSIAVASDYLGIYSLASPGGWNVIGKTPLQLLDFRAYPPTTMSVNDQLQLEAINKEQYDKIKSLHLDISAYNARY